MNSVCVALLLAVAICSAKELQIWKTTIYPKMVSPSVGDTGYYVYHFCIPVEQRPTNLDFELHMKINWIDSGFLPRKVLFDFNHNGRGVADFRDYSVTNKVFVVDHASMSAWDHFQEGVIITNGMIGSIEVTVLDEQLVPADLGGQCKPCDGFRDPCGVCQGDSSSCEYPVGCDGIPLSGARLCVEGKDVVYKDTQPKESHGLHNLVNPEGGVSATVAILSLVPIFLACCCTGLCLSADRQRRRRSSQSYTALKNLEAGGEKPCAITEAKVQPKIPQFDYVATQPTCVTDGGLVITADGVPFVYPITQAGNGSLVAHPPVSLAQIQNL